ncbi:hypothetical protein CI102_6247 [Trichoderma harzianum]|nr:hypothetical protein CI102_6247 [Trichoderma harzianum]
MCAAGGLGWSCGFARPLGRAANATACQGYGTRWEARDAAVYIPARWRALYPKVSRRHREGGGQAKAEIRACRVCLDEGEGQLNGALSLQSVNNWGKGRDQDRPEWRHTLEPFFAVWHPYWPADDQEPMIRYPRRTMATTCSKRP